MNIFQEILCLNIVNTKLDFIASVYEGKRFSSFL